MDEVEVRCDLVVDTDEIRYGSRLPHAIRSSKTLIVLVVVRAWLKSTWQ
jgi:hypothetical protein